MAWNRKAFRPHWRNGSSAPLSSTARTPNTYCPTPRFSTVRRESVGVHAESPSVNRMLGSVTVTMETGGSSSLRFSSLYRYETGSPEGASTSLPSHSTGVISPRLRSFDRSR